MKKILTEGLKYLDMKDQIIPIVGIDQYESSVGEDDDMMTISFVVKSKEAASDLTDWFERGYDWVVDAEVSPGEVTAGKYVVFVEISRRSGSPERIMEMLNDLETLTGIDDTEWKMRIDKTTVPANADVIRQRVKLTPHDYRADHEETLNEWREIAGIKTVSTYNDDEAMKILKRQAGIY